MSDDELKQLLALSVQQTRHLTDVVERFEKCAHVEFASLHKSLESLASKTRTIEVTAAATRRELNQALARLKAFEKEVATMFASVDSNQSA